MKKYETLEDIIGLVFEENSRSQYKISRYGKDPYRIQLTQINGGDFVTSWRLDNALKLLNEEKWKVVTSLSPNYEIY